MIDEKNVERARQGKLPPCDGSKNKPMHEFFCNHTGDRFSIGFKELGRTRGDGILPDSAYNSRSWWEFRSEHDDSNGKRRYYHALAWLTAGWRIDELSIADEQVVFVRFKDSKAKAFSASSIEPEKKNTEPSLVLKSLYSALSGAGQILLGGNTKNLPNPMGSIAVIFFGLGIFLMFIFKITVAFTIVFVLFGIWITTNVLRLILGKAFIPSLLGGLGVLLLTLATTKLGSVILGLLAVVIINFTGYGITGEETWGEMFGKSWTLLKGYIFG